MPEKPLSTWRRKYRVVPDGFAGWEVRTWTPWFPIWRQLSWCNTFLTHDDAYEFAKRFSESGKLV